MENLFFTSLTIQEFRQLLNDELASYFSANLQASSSNKQKFVDINGASKILSKSPNAIRVQISKGNLVSIKKGNRNYFEVEYLENWLSGHIGKS
jgi:hypothetical protein